MKRFNFWIEKELLEKLSREAKNNGHSNVSSFIRWILFKFFEDKK